MGPQRRVNLTTVRPYFQPIVSIEQHKVVGYEVLGRQIRSGVADSLGSFFWDPSVPVQEKLRVDQRIVSQALDYHQRRLDQPMLFVNINLNWWRLHDAPQWLTHLRQYGVDPETVVVEVTEDRFEGSAADLLAWVQTLRAHGVRIAVDDVGSGFSQLDRIAWFEPDIIKVDLRLVQSGATQASFYHLMQALSIIAGKMGSILLLEGVETEAELHLALSIGARYVQGYLFSPATPHFVSPDAYRPVIQNSLETLRERLQQQHMERRALADSVSSTIQHWVAETMQDSLGEWDGFLGALLMHMPSCCYRLYLCDADGYQLSSNVERLDEVGVRADPTFLGANWSARPYFVWNTMSAQSNQQGMLSEPYYDQNTQRTTVTFTYPLSPDRFLFADFMVKDGTREWIQELAKSGTLFQTL